MDKIYLNNLQFYGYHGVFSEENQLGQRFNVDIQLHLSLERAGKSDQMEDSINYGEVYELVKEIVEGEAKNLLEAVAQAISQALFVHFPLLKACTIKLIKPDPPIAGHYESVAVEIYRERDNE